MPNLKYLLNRKVSRSTAFLGLIWGKLLTQSITPFLGGPDDFENYIKTRVIKYCKFTLYFA